jgi:L-lactate dehydrogenase complex protein LldF
MTELAQPPRRFRVIAQGALADAHKQGALDQATERLMDGRTGAWASLPDLEQLRQRAHDARMSVIRDLDTHVARFRANAEAAGATVHEAATAEEAAALVTRICVEAGASLVGKSKSMLSEEIGLNDALEHAGIKAVETDLGEYILQLAGEHPVHLIVPAIEKTAADAAVLLGAVEGKELPAEVEPLLQAARRQLRETFLAADVGITGANFAVSDTGSICLVSNEGNARLVSSLPRIHVALIGRERIVESLDDLSVMLRLLARSATGQPLTSYTTLITGPSREGEQDGPEQLHLVLVDNGRTKLLDTKYDEMLACIRCGACLNVCPIYRKSGGSAYSGVYSGPMGAVLVPLLVGLESAPALPHASSLCGACTDSCPVKIPLHELLLELRADLVEQHASSRLERLAFTLWSYAWSTRLGYRVTTRLARLGQPFGAIAGPGRTWVKPGRTLPRLAKRPFRAR